MSAKPKEKWEKEFDKLTGCDGIALKTILINNPSEFNEFLRKVKSFIQKTISQEVKEAGGKTLREAGGKTLREEIRKMVTGICWNPYCEGDATCLVERNKALDQIMSLFKNTLEKAVGEELKKLNRWLIKQELPTPDCHQSHRDLIAGYNQAWRKMWHRFIYEYAKRRIISSSAFQRDSTMFIESLLKSTLERVVGEDEEMLPRRKDKIYGELGKPPSTFEYEDPGNDVISGRNQLRQEQRKRIKEAIGE